MRVKRSLLILGLLLIADWASAADQVVSDLGDNGGANQLRAKITAAQNTGGGTITFSVTGSVELTPGLGTLPTITSSVTIDGGSLVTINGNFVRIFVVEGSGNLTLKSLTVRDGHANADGGAIQHTGSGTVTIDNCIFKDNTTTDAWSGGAIVTVGKLNISNSEFAINSAGNGGALYPRFGAVVNITGSIFRNNRTLNATNGFGGAILLWDGPKVTVSNTVFSNNYANFGGAIYVLPNSTLTMNNNCALTGNVTERDTAPGGAIYNAGAATLSSTTISGNRANVGSGIYSSGTLQLTDVTVDSNNGSYSNSRGGGISASGTVTITNSVISNNKASSGGGIQATGTFVLSNVRLSGNSASLGGGIAFESGSLEMNDGCVLQNNTSEFSGGGIDAKAAFLLRNATFIGNKAVFLGGAIHAEGGGTLENVILDGNSTTLQPAVGQGGGIASSGTLNLTAVTFSNNAANTAGGALRNFGQAFLTNVTFSGNSAASNGGGGITNSGNLTATNVTFSGNSGASGGGIRHLSGATTTLRNTVVANSPSGGNCFRIAGSSPITSMGGNLSNDNSCADSLTQPSDKNGSQFDPLLGALANNGGFTPTHLPGEASPLIDNGVSSGAPTVDQRGTTRPQGAAFDTGAVEVVPAPPPTPTPTATPPPNRFANISTRLRVETGNNVLIGGFIVTGSMQKRIIVRALGPSLPVEDRLANPLLELYDANAQLIDSNDNWEDAPNRQEIIDSTIPPQNALEAAILRNVELGAYTAVVRDVADGQGVGLVEVYDLGNNQDSKLANISTRGRVLTGDNVMIGGFIATGSHAQRVIVRAIGPSLGIPGQLEDPVLELFDGDGNAIAANNNWKDSQQAEIEATTIPPSNELESAIVTFLPPGAYTAIVRGVDETTGIALVEAYGLQ